MKYRNTSNNISQMATRTGSVRRMLAVVIMTVLAMALILTAVFGAAFLRGDAASLQEKKTGWYAVQKVRTIM